MDGASILKLAVFVVFLTLNPKVYYCQMFPMPVFTPRPLCVSQFTLVNHACSALPIKLVNFPTTPLTPIPPAPSPPSPDNGNDNDKHHGHGHSHGHHHRHEQHSDQGSYQETPVEHECCRWLTALDGQCVCDLLVHLPTFLSRPAHQYSVAVDDSCIVTFTCGSRIRPGTVH